MNVKSLFSVSAIALASMSAQAIPLPPPPINLIVNGSFEAPVLPTDSWDILYGGAVSGWTAGPHGIELRTNVDGFAQDGLNFVELDTTQNSWMEQTVTISTAGSYLLSFWYNSRPGVVAPTDMLGWSFGEGASGVVKPSDPANPTGTWRQFSQTFAFSGPQQVDLRFHATGSSNSFGGSLDSVSVTAVPEPESYAMMLAGLGLMGAIARRRNKSQA
jgi:hypothetical protein